MSLRCFDHFNDSGKSICPVCKTSKDEKTILIPIDGTSDGDICEAKQVHLNCLSLRFNDSGIIYQEVKGR